MPRQSFCNLRLPFAIGSGIRAAALALPALALAVPVCSAQVPSTNYALALRWHGYADTDLAFSEFFNSEHTVSARFMLQYPRAFEGPIFSVKGAGSYSIGQADFRSNGVWAPKLMVRIGPNTAYYTIGAGTESPAGKWMHIAVVRKNNYTGWLVTGATFLVYLDGVHREKDGGGDLAVDAAHLASPSGVLRFGAEDADAVTSKTQFFGLIDDVAVFNRRLTGSEVQSLATETRLKGTEPGLLAGYSFDDATPANYPLFAAMSRPVTRSGYHCFRTEVSQARSNTADATRMPLPYHVFNMTLPFMWGDVLRVEQGWGGLSSHNGYAAFALDLVKAATAKAADGVEEPYWLPNVYSAGMNIYSGCTGKVTYIYDKGDLDPYDADGDTRDYKNKVAVEPLPGLHVSYIHVLTGSVQSALAAYGSTPFSIPAGTLVGRIGNALQPAKGIDTSNWHLHLAAGNKGGVSVPLIFSDYENWDPASRKWIRVAKGVPAAGQYIRVPYLFSSDM